MAQSEFHAKLAQIMDARGEVVLESPVHCLDVHKCRVYYGETVRGLRAGPSLGASLSSMRKRAQIIDAREEVVLESRVYCHNVHSQSELWHNFRGWPMKEDARLHGQYCRP